MSATYYGFGTLPERVPSGRVLAHNHVLHTDKTRCGVRGFRCWTWSKADVPPHFTACGCGWSGLPHVSNAKFQVALREEAA